MALAGVAVLAACVAEIPARVTTIHVPAGGSLQEAIDRAAPGDVITLEAGARYVGNFVLPAHAGEAFITIQTAPTADWLPAHGQRVAPEDAPSLAKIVSPNELPALQTAAGAHHWRLVLLEFLPNATPAGDVIRLGDGSSRQRRLEDVPYEIEIDRCLVRGDATVGQKRGVALNSAQTRIVNSYFADFKLAGQDTQAIGGWNGPGPYVIENNYLEAAGENVMFGGADPSIPGLVPSDITIRENHFSKPLHWRDERWTVKNLFELKNARRVLIEHNLFEHNWRAAQPGFAILFTPRNQNGTAPWSGVQEVTFRGNIVRKVAAVFNVLGYDDNHPSAQTTDLVIEHNLITDVDGAAWGGGNGALLQIGGPARNIRVDHNTAVQSGNVITAYGRATDGLAFTNNLVLHNEYGVKGTARATGHDTLRDFYPGAIFTHNVLAGGPAGNYPANNWFPSIASWRAQFRDANAGDYRLAPSSTYAGAGSDGKDLGVDHAIVSPALAAPHGRR